MNGYRGKEELYERILVPTLMYRSKLWSIQGTERTKLNV